MDVDAFYDMTPRQFRNKVVGFNDQQNELQEQEWQRARVISFHAIKGHDTRNKIKDAQSLFKLPGDSPKNKVAPPPMTSAQAMALAQKWK